MRFPPFLTPSALKTTLTSALASGGILMAGVQPAEAIIPVLTISNAQSNYTNPDEGLGSFGYAFDLNGSAIIDGLGLYAPIEWTTGTYKVSLWSYTASSVTLLDTVTFNGGDAYPIVGSYAWIPIPQRTLAGTPGDPAVGYIIGAEGSFTNPPVGQQGAFTTSTYNFASPFFTEGNGFSYDTGGIPPFPQPVNFDPAVLNNGFFNPNLSLVPGPLPVLGAAAGFGWTRRLRKRIRASK